jgi:hypothetical protein
MRLAQLLDYLGDQTRDDTCEVNRSPDENALLRIGLT